MGGVAAGSQARAMPTNPRQSIEHQLADSAHELQRAAGRLQKHAADADQVPALGSALAHVQEALDRLCVGMLQMANGVVDWVQHRWPARRRGPPSAGSRGPLLPPARHRRGASRAARRVHIEPILDTSSARGAELRCGSSRVRFICVAGGVLSPWPAVTVPMTLEVLTPRWLYPEHRRRRGTAVLVAAVRARFPRVRRKTSE